MVVVPLEPDEPLVVPVELDELPELDDPEGVLDDFLVVTVDFGFVTVLVGVLAAVEDEEVDEEVVDVDVVRVVAACVVEATWCRTWWRTLAVLVSTSDFGAGAAGAATSFWGCTGLGAFDAAEDTAGVSRATTIAPVPSAAPTPVAAVTRRTRRRTLSRWAAAAALLVSMTPTLSPATEAGLNLRCAQPVNLGRALAIERSGPDLGYR
ncbi:MAG: hypothetical protein ACTHK4_06680 [Mycobacteriales bacterium]